MIFHFNSFNQLIAAFIHLFAAVCKSFGSFIAILKRNIDVAAHFIFKFPFMPIWNSSFAESVNKVFNTKPIRNSQHPMTKTKKAISILFVFHSLASALFLPFCIYIFIFGLFP